MRMSEALGSMCHSRKRWPVPNLVPCFGICPSCLWILSYCIWNTGIYKHAPLTEFFLIVYINWNRLVELEDVCFC